MARRDASVENRPSYKVKGVLVLQSQGGLLCGRQRNNQTERKGEERLEIKGGNGRRSYPHTDRNKTDWWGTRLFRPENKRACYQKREREKKEERGRDRRPRKGSRHCHGPGSPMLPRPNAISCLFGKNVRGSLKP